jgi:hypothetical protein
MKGFSVSEKKPYVNKKITVNLTEKCIGLSGFKVQKYMISLPPLENAL